jgi:DNA replication and repair protein RecF
LARDVVPARYGVPLVAVRRLTLSEFRCYAATRIEVDAGVVVLTGANGAGKTNLLEALSLLTPGRGLRRARLGDLKRQQAPDTAGWGVAARVHTADGWVDLGTGADPTAAGDGERRLVRVDGQVARSQSVLSEHLSAVWLTPQMDRLFTEGRADRRRFFDRLVYAFDPQHAARLSAYERAMRDRSRLLKEARDGRRPDGAWLAALEDQMACQGVAASAARMDMMARLNAALVEADGPFPRAVVALDGVVEAQLAQGPALAVEDWLRATLAANRAIDGAAGVATEGPHRVELEVTHAGKAMPAALCSTGEQKALLIAIILANAQLISALRGRPPLLLLDEIVAHLDVDRRAALFERLAAFGGQAWLTGTDAALFAPLREVACFLTVDDARIVSL